MSGMKLTTVMRNRDAIVILGDELQQYLPAAIALAIFLS